MKSTAVQPINTAVQRCAIICRSTEIASRYKIVGENRAKMENTLEHRRILRIESSAEHSRCTCVDRPSRSHHEQFRIQSSAHRAAVQSCVVSMTFPLL